MADEEPLFKHDCDRCVFLGRHTGDDDHGAGVRTVDLYVCARDGVIDEAVEVLEIVHESVTSLPGVALVVRECINKVSALLGEEGS